MMKLSSSQLEAFYAVAQTLNFSKAGATLGITQSAVSQRLSNLEYDLGTTLMLRDSARPRLTETGEKLFRHCQIQNQMEAEILSAFKPDKNNELKGIVRVGGFSSVMRSMTIPALAPLMRDNQNLMALFISRELDELMALLKRSEVDMILTTNDPNREDLKADFLGYDEHVLVESKNYPNSEIYLDHDSDDATTNAYFKLLKISFKKIKKRYLDDSYSLIEGVREGYGKAVISRHLIAEESDFRILNSSTSLKIPVYLVYYNQDFYGKIQSETTKAILNYFQKNLKQER